jgi:hypothetical protein
VGTNIAAYGAVLGDGEDVLRGLNPIHCDGGLPTEGCFMLRRNDPPDDGPSFGIQEAPAEKAATAPLGVAQGVAPGLLATLIPAGFGIARLNVGEALAEVRGRGVGFVQKDDESWGDYKDAHAMLTGYQEFRNRDLKDLQRYLAKLASGTVLKPPSVTT